MNNNKYDVNGDGTVNMKDANEISEALLQGNKDPRFDANDDGNVDINDLVDTIDEMLNPKPNDEDKVFTVKDVTFKMRKIDGGTFTMGTPPTETGSGTNERPQHVVHITKPFWICETQVTQALWEAIMGNNPSKFKGNANNPVERVSWNDCQSFIEKLNKLTGETFRLPTEAEWEFASRGGNKSQGTIFAGSNTPKEVAWYTSNSGGTTKAVAQKKANELGLYDMSGNISEWVSDYYAAYPSEQQTDPQGNVTGTYRTYRNGGFGDAAKNCRCGYRYPATPTYKLDSLGFRLAM